MIAGDTCHFNKSALKYTTLLVTKSFQGVPLLVFVASEGEQRLLRWQSLHAHKFIVLKNFKCHKN